MKKYDKILFIGMDNTCRTILAETILRKVAKNLDIQIASRGMVVLFAEPYNQKAVKVLQNHGLKPSFNSSIPLALEEIDERTLVLTPRFTDKVKMIEEFHQQENVYTIKEYAGEDGEIVNPYGEEMEIYETCYKEIYRLMTKIRKRLLSEESDR